MKVDQKEKLKVDQEEKLKVDQEDKLEATFTAKLKTGEEVLVSKEHYLQYRGNFE